MKWGIVRKMVTGIVVVSAVTYSTSAFFIFGLKDLLAPEMANWLYVGGVLAMGVMWTGILGWLAARWFVAPLVRLTEAVKQAASGDLTVHVPIPSRKDEIHKLTVSFRDLMNELRRVIGDISSHAESTHSSAAALSEAMNEAAQEVVAIGELMEGISGSAAGQERSAAMTLAVTEAMSEDAAEMAKQARIAMNTAVHMQASIGTNARLIGKLAEDLKGFGKWNEQMLDWVGGLDKEAKQIGAISLMVKEITDQTQLLALNAAIEASHAGEHGRGFGVVASEIRKLSEQSVGAVEQINTILGLVEKRIRQVVEQMHEQSARVREQSASGEQASEALLGIRDSTSRTAESVRSITELALQQSDGVKQAYEQCRQLSEAARSIAGSTRQVTQSTQQQTAILEEVASTSDLLREGADSLASNVRRFRL